MTSYAPNEVPDSQFYSTSKVAEMFGVTPATVRNWVKEGKLRSITINRRMRIERASVRELANHMYPSKPGPLR
jgi:excisionase family DNA binding protein